MSKSYCRTPHQYDGTRSTIRNMRDLLPSILAKMSKGVLQHADLILAAWPALIGPALVCMAQAMSFSEGILVVKVNNSTLYSLLSQNEKPRLLRLLRQKFPTVEIKNIYFRIG